MSATLAVSRVSKNFGPLLALDDVSFEVHPGRLTGFVGANGAGKTTTMRIVLGVLKASSGTVSFDGKPLDAVARRRFGYMPEERGLYPKMKIGEQVAFLGEVHGMSHADAKARATAILTDLGLGERTGDLLQKLSLGNQQRVQIAASLIHDPTLLVLDEPFSGLDPIAVDHMASELRKRADAGVPVLFSSHQLDLVEELCDDIVIVDKGRVVASGDAATLRRERGGRKYKITVSAPLADVEAALSATPGVEGLERRGGGTVVVSVAENLDDQALLAAAQRSGPVREFAPVEATLAEIFRGTVTK